MIAKRLSGLGWWASALYMTGLSVGSGGAAVYLYRLFESRRGWAEARAAAADSADLAAKAMAWSPALLSAVAMVALTLAVLSWRRWSPALYLTLVAAPGALVALLLVNRWLAAAEGRFYNHSRYVRLFKLGALPLAVGSGLLLVIVAVDAIRGGRTRVG